MFVNLSNLPDPPTEYQTTIRDFSGGVNMSKAPTDIMDNQCAQMQNMLWENGALRTRRGTTPAAVMDAQWLDFGDYQSCNPVAVFERVWHGAVFMAFLVRGAGAEMFLKIAAYSEKAHGYEVFQEEFVPWFPAGLEGWTGTFFLFGEKLYFKAPGIYAEIEYDEESEVAFPFLVHEVTPYRPVVQINTSRSGVGDLYQPENRICDEKELWFNADDGSVVAELPADGVRKSFYIGYQRINLKPTGLVDGALTSVDEVYVAANLMEQVASLTGPGQYTVALDKGAITFYDAPPLGTKVTVRATLSARDYKLPIGLTNVTFLSVTVGETEYQQVSGPTISNGQYAVISTGSAGTPPKIRFAGTLGQYGDAAGNANKIKVVYRAENVKAKTSIYDCYIATGYGATGIEQNCVVFAGASEQKNAIFWSGNDANGANPGYFPIDNYNIVGEYSDPVTAFGRQQNKLVVFQRGRISAATFALTEVDGRTVVSLNTQNINDTIGCDVPGTVQLIENNLVWLSKKGGVMYLKDSTYAYETLVASISGNINSELIPFLNDPAATLRASSFDDGERYWLTVNNGQDTVCYVWDYSIRGYTHDAEKLSWFPQKGFDAIAWAQSGKDVYGLYTQNLSDAASEKNFLFTFAQESAEQFFDIIGAATPRFARSKTMTFGSFDVLKNITKIILSMDTQKRAEAKMIYHSDYETREDLTLLDNTFEHAQSNRGIVLAVRVRRPKCRHIHQFAFELRCDETMPYGANLVSAQIFYTAAGRTKAGRRM